MGMNLQEDLRKIELFGCLTDEQMDHMAMGSWKVSFHAGRNLITQGDKEGDILVILSGEADVIKRDDGGGEGRKLATVGEGTILGEMAALTKEAAAADVIAVSTCQAIHIPRKVFLDAVKKNLTSMTKLTTTVVKRYRAMMGS